MSKHSKNNTSSTVFTYGEKKMLKGVYGTLNQRLGQDSQKLFEMCTLCSQTIIDPMACEEGHVFQYLMKQKKEKEIKLKKYNQELQRKQRQSKQEEQVTNAKKVQLFDKYDNYTDINIRAQFKTGMEIKKPEPQFLIKPTGKYELNNQKKNYTKTSFWAIEQTPIYQPALKKQQHPNICPGGKHKLSIKKLREIKIKIIQGVFCCNLCTKEISRQKVGCYKCGHLLCLGCKNNKCQICEKADSWINLQQSASAFSSKGKANVVKYTHAFIS